MYFHVIICDWMCIYVYMYNVYMLTHAQVYGWSPSCRRASMGRPIGPAWIRCRCSWDSTCACDGALVTCSAVPHPGQT